MQKKSQILFPSTLTMLWQFCCRWRCKNELFTKIFYSQQNKMEWSNCTRSVL